MAGRCPAAAASRPTPSSLSAFPTSFEGYDGWSGTNAWAVKAPRLPDLAKEDRQRRAFPDKGAREIREDLDLDLTPLRPVQELAGRPGRTFFILDGRATSHIVIEGETGALLMQASDYLLRAALRQAGYPDQEYEWRYNEHHALLVRVDPKSGEKLGAIRPIQTTFNPPMI